MTTETLGEVLDISEITTDRIRIVRSVCRRDSGKACARTDIFRERLPIEQEPPRLTEEYFLRSVGEIGIRNIIMLSENRELNDAASILFSHLRGRVDDARAIEEIRRVIVFSRALELMPYPHA